ncbi:MAG: 50S ribosomal protein L31 [bacterium]
MKKLESKENTQKAEEIKNYPNAKIKCGCGNTFTVSSTQPEMEIEICSACHPYYTGQKKVVDIAGRVERFKERFEKFQKRSQTAKKK